MKKYRIVINGKTYERVKTRKKRPAGQSRNQPSGKGQPQRKGQAQRPGQPQGRTGQPVYPGIPGGARQAHRQNPQQNRPAAAAQRPARKGVYGTSKKRHYRVKTRFKVLVIGLCVFIVMGFSYVLSPLVGSEQETADLPGESVQTAAKPGQGTGEKAKNTSRKDTPSDTGSQGDKSSEYLVLVNKTHKIADRKPPEDLITLKTGSKPGITTENNKLRKVPAKHFYNLVKGAEAKGLEIVVTSAYRPYDYQKKLHDRYENADGSVKANTYSAKAGYSEHETGLCLDVSSPSVNYNLAQAYGTTEEGKWLAEHAHRYGFIIRYPKGKEKITGYDYEPWHIRYVGKDAAAEIYKKKQTLEEYLNKQ